jgi:homoprotocatechuate degradation regulator HpaR
LGVYFRPVLATHDLTDPQWRVLRILDVSDECDVSNLARRSFLMQPSLSRILRDLTARGLIARRTSSKDGRRYFQSLTPKGRRLLNEVAPEFDPVFRKIEDCFDAKRIQHLNEELAQLLEALQRNSVSAEDSVGDDDGETS